MLQNYPVEVHIKQILGYLVLKKFLDMNYWSKELLILLEVFKMISKMIAETIPTFKYK